MTLLLLLGQLWTAIYDPKAVLQGHWQSCRQEDGSYVEKVFEHTHIVKPPTGKPYVVIDWEFHLGPYHSFALYTPDTVPDDDNHYTPTNLLGAKPDVEVDYGRGRRQWRVSSLRLWVSIVLAGGSRGDCEGFLIRVEKTP